MQILGDFVGYFGFGFGFLRQVLSMYSKLASNSQSFCLTLARITGVYHHCWLKMKKDCIFLTTGLREYDL
jgi:hypothetical protein